MSSSQQPPEVDQIYRRIALWHSLCQGALCFLAGWVEATVMFKGWDWPWYVVTAAGWLGGLEIARSLARRQLAHELWRWMNERGDQQ